jgi:hypothetical protein
MLVGYFTFVFNIFYDIFIDIKVCLKDKAMKNFHIKKQIDIVNTGFDLPEKKAIRIKKITRWKRAAKAVAKHSKSVNKEFQKFSRLKKIC